MYIYIYIYMYMYMYRGGLAMKKTCGSLGFMPGMKPGPQICGDNNKHF